MILVYFFNRLLKIMPFALDVHEESVQMPDVSQPSLPMSEISGLVWTELPAPLPDRLIGDDDSSLCQELLNVSEAQAESVIQPDSVTDDLGRESVSVVAGSIGFHQTGLRGAGSS